jgi:hypothetical protein
MIEENKKGKQADEKVEIANALASVASTAILYNSWDKRSEIDANEKLKLAEYKTMENIELAKLKENSFQFIVQSLANDVGYTNERAIESAYRFEQRHKDLSQHEIKLKSDRESLEYEKKTWAYSYAGCGLLVGVLIGYYLHKKNIIL